MNPHDRNGHRILSPACLPIPPSKRINFNISKNLLHIYNQYLTMFFTKYVNFFFLFFFCRHSLTRTNNYSFGDYHFTFKLCTCCIFMLTFHLLHTYNHLSTIFFTKLKDFFYYFLKYSFKEFGIAL